MQASDYPVTFPYGATSYPYGPTGYAGPYHRGDDRYMPDNTPILVNGVEIGLSGHSGEVTGPHLHIGRFVNGKDTNPNGQGFSLKTPAKVTEVSFDADDGNYVAINDADGVRWVYLHMTKQTVSSGQLIKGDDMTLQANDVAELFRLWAGREPDADEVKGLTGKYLADATAYLRQSGGGQMIAAYRLVGKRAIDEKWLQNIQDLNTDISKLKNSGIDTSKISALAKQADDLEQSIKELNK